MFRFLPGRQRSKNRPVTLVTPAEFRRELARERVRSTRRSFPFCVVELTLQPPRRDSHRRAWFRRDRRVIASILHCNTRITDHKCELRSGTFLWLLTDTPEMGGRGALLRIVDLLSDRGIEVTSKLDVHDGDSFGHDDPVDGYGPAIGNRSSDVAKRCDSGERGQSSNLKLRDSNPRRSDLLESNHPESAELNGNSSGERLSDSSVAMLAKPTRLMTASTKATARQSEVAVAEQMFEPEFQTWVRVDRQSIVYPDAFTTQSRWAAMIKRSVDVVGSSVGLIVLSPVIVTALALVRLSDGQPAMFKQTREGRGGRPFTIYKMRTMRIDAESQQDALRSLSHRDGPAFKIDGDPRITPIGNFLRKTCLDELPQLLNVLRGDMSLVGPRPLPWHESRACSRWHRRRLEIRPGMTCYWQIDKASVTTFDQWMRLDLLYLEKRGFLEDMKLIVRTVAVPLFGRGGE